LLIFDWWDSWTYGGLPPGFFYFQSGVRLPCRSIRQAQLITKVRWQLVACQCLLSPLFSTKRQPSISNKLDSFKVIGGQPLKGELQPQGAKNEALQIVSAVLLTDEHVTISNVPDILDVNKLIELLQGLGVTVERLCARIATGFAPARSITYSFGWVYARRATPPRFGHVDRRPPARFGRATCPNREATRLGGGGSIHTFTAYSNSGRNSNTTTKKTFIYWTAPRRGFRELISTWAEFAVTGTANVVMAAVLAKGKTSSITRHANLMSSNFPNAGAWAPGSKTRFQSAAHRRCGKTGRHRTPLPADMIEIGSFIGCQNPKTQKPIDEKYILIIKKLNLCYIIFKEIKWNNEFSVLPYVIFLKIYLSF